MKRDALESRIFGFTTRSADEIARTLGVDLTRGLAEEEAKRRLRTEGPNALEARETFWWMILLRQFRSPFIYLLIGAVLIAAFLSEYINALLILLFVLINALLGFYQEFRSEQALSILRSYVVQQARVLRDGIQRLVRVEEVVPGDLVILATGDRVPADLRILEEHDLLIDESGMSGESVPIKKVAGSLAQPATTLFTASNMAFSGTTVVQGSAKGVVVATGKASILGTIAQLTVETVRASSFSKGITRLSGFVLRLIALTLLFVFLTNIALKGTRVNIPELLVFTIALAVSVVPEALPLVTTFSLSRGALLLAKRHVVVKRLSAIEDLGGIEVLCSDKTGTLTENVLSVAGFSPGHDPDLILAAGLVSRDIVAGKTTPGNAFDAAIRGAFSARDKAAVSDYELVQEDPFDPVRRSSSALVRNQARTWLIVRGAPEAVLSRCHRLPAGERHRLRRWMRDEGRQGKRVIAVARRSVADPAARPTTRDLHCLGLIAFSDPLKKSASEAVNHAKKLGVVIKILTGDSPEVAGAVATEIGLVDSPEAVITGDWLETLSPHKRQQAIDETVVFARVTPQQKYAIIQELRKHHEVGFLGEGINDAPALKVANVALVVQGAADIAEDAADIILLQKSLHVIVEGIQEGRKVFSNTLKYIKATLASNFGNFYAVAISSLFIEFLPMLPIQILLLNLLSDFPMISISTDRVDRSELTRPQRYDLKELALLATILGIVSSVFDFIFFALYYRTSPAVLQTNWFLASVLTELAFLFSIRTRVPLYRASLPSVAVLGLSAITIVVTIALPFLRLGQELFAMTPPTWTHLATLFSLVFLYLAISEVVKLLYYRYAEQK